jgi:fibronectin type 3 domain-containing protein
LSATASGTQTVNLTWSASTPASGCTISGYEVYRNGALVGSPATTSYSDSGLNANTTYTYYVVALDNQSHTSAASSTAQATTAASTTVPSNPTNVSAKAVTAGSVSLSWNASSDSSGIYGYMIYRNNAYYATVTSGTSFTDYKVTANSYYTYAVSAFDKSNNQSAVVSAAGYVHTPSATSTSAPSTPSGLKVVVTTDDSAAVEWNASTDRLGVAGYHIYRNGHQVATITSGTSYTSYCLQPSTNYSFAVVAFDSSANTSSQSSTVSTRTEAGSVACSNGDLNNDGKVNYLDLSIMLDHWGSKSPTVAQGDMNADGAVNMTDLQFLLSHWGQ